MAIIAFFIYKLLTFVRKTNSASLIKGIFLLLAALWFSNVLHLSVVNYLLSRAFEMGLFMLIVVFQPEIRSILEKVGNSKLSGLFSGKQPAGNLENAILQTVLACSDMSDTRTGALIVFERSNNLDAYIKTGTIVDAAPAVELLKNIFYNKAPLHDGAVIIRGGRIAGAACMLPLSGNSNISSALGMRHRAGIGMSEKSDAVVVIVSEETGDISVATEGMLRRGLKPDTLEKLIRAELMPDDSEKKGIFKSRKSRKSAEE
ncbi:MAG: diadenylate cyclase CdaA [Oscillospiraceae bacterium]|nr:diadenylate cyclase CdaA [Oscillospiraceae bacterium]